MEPTGIRKRLSLNFFDPDLATKTPPKPVKPKIKKRTSILEIAQRNASAEEYRASVFDGLETKRRLSTWKSSKSRDPKGPEFAVYRLDSPDLAAKVSKDTDIDLSYSDLGYLAQLYKNSVSHNNTWETDDVDSPATTNEKFRRYVGTPGGGYSKALYDSVNYDLLNNAPRTKRKQSLHSQVGDRRQSLADKPRSSSVHSNVTSHTPNLIVIKKSPARLSVSSRKSVMTEQKRENNRRVSKAKLDLRDPLPEPPKNSVQYMATPPSPNFVIAKRKKSAPSARSSVRFSVVEDAMELAEQLEKTKKSSRRKSHHADKKKRGSFTEADYVQSSEDREKDIETLREQLKRTLTTEPVSQSTSPDSDYVSHSSNRQSGHTSSSSASSASSSSSSSGDSESSSDSDSESDSGSSSSSSSSSSGSSSGSRSRSSSASSSDSERYTRKSRGDKYAVKGKKTAKHHETGEEVQDGNVLLGDVSQRVEKKSIICVIL